MSSSHRKWRMHVETDPNQREISIVKVCKQSNKTNKESSTASSSDTDNESYCYKTALVNGVSFNVGCTQSRWDELNKIVEYKDTDILVATYPKCGTTWVEQIILLLLNNGDSTLLNPATKNTYRPGTKEKGKIWLEACLNQTSTIASIFAEFNTLTIDEVNSAPSPRVIKTHAPVSLLLGCSGQGVQRLPQNMKVIVVTRNPLDACVSAYYHGFNPFKSGWPFSAWVTAFLSGYTAHGWWFEWVSEWWKEKLNFPTQIHWIQFEDVKTHPKEEIKKLALFLNIHNNSTMNNNNNNMSNNSTNNNSIDNTKSSNNNNTNNTNNDNNYHDDNALDQLVDNVYEASTFENMKSQMEQKMEQNGLQHMRKGTRGDWKQHFDIDAADEVKFKKSIHDDKNDNSSNSNKNDNSAKNDNSNNNDKSDNSFNYNQHDNSDNSVITEREELQYLKNQFFELYQEYCHWTGLAYEYYFDEVTGDVLKFH